MSKSNQEEIKITYLPFPECVKKRSGVYLGGIENFDIPFREIQDNALDELSSGYGDTVLLSTNFNGFNFVADNGRGLPIVMSEQDPNITQAYLSLSTLHSGSKFEASETATRTGLNGVGSAATQAVSSIYIMMSRITENNYNRSTSEVKKVWESAGPRSKKDLYYILVFEQGYLVHEGAGKLSELEATIFKGIDNYVRIPEGMSTIVLFKGNNEIYESIEAHIPLVNLEYFMLIQEKFYNRRVNIIIDGQRLSSSFKPYKYEITKTIIPADTSSNKRVDVYFTFEIDDSYGSKEGFGSINGLDSKGLHLQIAESCYKTALKDYYKIKHDSLMQGLRYCVVMIANEVLFSSQTKENLKSITKVKTTDFAEVVKEIQRIFKKSPDYWDLHVERLQAYSDSLKSLSAIEKADRMMNNNDNGFYKSKANIVDGFSDATDKDRWNCELFLCEGISPAGSLKSGRRPINGVLQQAILPLRGKVLNVSEVNINKALENKEISTIFTLLKVGIQENNVTSGCKTVEEALEMLRQRSRYGKICIAVDSDSDGSQIASLILYLFSKYARFLIDLGCVYLSVSPLFEQKGRYFYPGDQIDPSTGFPVGLDTSKPFRRWKGLGSIPKELIYDSFFNPATRRLVRVTSEGIDYAMSLTEDINVRKQLLIESGIISNPFNLKD